MATPLIEVYDSFLSKVTDYSFIKLNEDGILEDILFNHLKSAIIRFKVCNKDLNFDLTKNEFVSDLNFEEIEILSTLMVLSYVSGKILNVKNIEPTLTDKEYQRYSSANHLKELQSLKNNIQSDISHLMSEYSLADGLENLL